MAAQGQGGYPDFHDQVALGLMPGWQHVRRWNENPQVDQTQEEMSNIASGIRTLPTSASVVTIASSSAEDGAGTSTGILSVMVYYLDANWLERVETVTLNGTGNVTTTGTAIRFLAAHTATVGSAGAAVGNITFTVGGNAQSRIKIGQNETRETAFACPDDKYILLRSFEMGTGRSSTVDVDIAMEVRDQTTGVWYTVVSAEIYQQTVDLTDKRILLGPRDDFRVLVTASGASGPACFVTVHGYKIDKNLIESMGSRYPRTGVPPIAR